MQISVEEKVMKIPGNAAKFRWIALISLVALLSAIAIFYPAARAGKVYASQEKEAARETDGDQSTSLTDQADLNVSVYISNFALTLIDHILTLPRYTSSLNITSHSLNTTPQP